MSAPVVPFRTKAEIKQAELEERLAALPEGARKFATTLATIPDYTYPNTMPQLHPPPAPGLESAIAAALYMEAYCCAIVASGYFKR